MSIASDPKHVPATYVDAYSVDVSTEHVRLVFGHTVEGGHIWHGAERMSRATAEQLHAMLGELLGTQLPAQTKQ